MRRHLRERITVRRDTYARDANKEFVPTQVNVVTNEPADVMVRTIGSSAYVEGQPYVENVWEVELRAQPNLTTRPGELTVVWEGLELGVETMVYLDERRRWIRYKTKLRQTAA